MKIYVYASTADRDLAFRKNQVRTMFSALKPDLITTLQDDLSTVRYSDDVNVQCITYMRNRNDEAYQRLKQTLKDYDIVIIQSYGCRVLGQELDALTIYDAGLSWQCQPSMQDGPEMRNVYRSWTIAAHIKACIELDKPFMLYTFDPMIDCKYGIKRMHGFAETSDMRLIPFMEASMQVVDKYDAKPSYKTLDFVYSAKFTTFDYKADARTELHNAIASTEFCDEQAIRYDIETSSGWVNVGGFIEYDEQNYHDLLKHARFTVCPPNYDGRCYSVKRAVEAMMLGTLPLFVGSVKETGLSKMWQPILNLQMQYDITQDTLQNIKLITETDRLATINRVLSMSKTICVRRLLFEYIVNWNNFKHEYAQFCQL